MVGRFVENLLYGERFAHLEQWKFIDFKNMGVNLPSFVYCEAFFGLLFALSWYHAFCLQSSQAKRRYQICLFLAALLGGVGNDVIFTFLPLVDNFWHSQGTVMLSPRFPLYILFWYAGWLYIPFSIASSMRIAAASPFVEAAMVSLLSACFYLPWDYVGAKFVWWSWHTTDNALGERWLGVPSASTLWTLVFGYMWAFIVRKCLGEKKSNEEHGLSVGVCFRTLCAVFTLSVPLMMVGMSCLGGLLTFQFPAPPTTLSVLFTTVLLLSTFVHSLKTVAVPKVEGRPINPDNIWLLRLLVRLHFLFLFCVLMVFDPSNHISTGVHQEYGPCGVKALDISGLSRSLYTCPEDLGQSYVQHSVDSCGVKSNREVIEPSINGNTTHWYSICGKAKGDNWVIHACIVLGAAFTLFEVTVVAFLGEKGRI